jgi:hypothetical protein
MSNETEQRERGIQGQQDQAAQILAQEAEIAEQRTLLERLLRSRVWQGSDPLYLDLIAHLDGSKKAGWSEVLGILNDGSTPNGNTREQLAAYAHEAWSGWMEYLFSKCDKQKYELIIPAWAVERWGRQMHTPYADLSDKEKESDRAEADKMLAIINGSTPREEEDAAPPDDEPLTREVRHRVALMRDNTRLRQRVAELEQAITKPVENWLDNRAEVTRLREGLETVRKWLTQKGLSPDEYDMVMDFISNALAGEKGAESEDNTATTTIGNSLVDTGGNSNRTDGNTEESGGSEVGKDADASIQQAQTPLSESLELGRRQCNASNSTVGGDPAGRLDLANAIFLNDMAHQIEQRDADVVAAIAALTAGQYRIEEEDRQQRDLWSKQQEKIDALTEAVLLLGTEVAIPKRKRETTIALGKLRKNGGE